MLWEGGNIGKLLIMEFTDNESAAFSDIMNMLQKYQDFRRYTLKDEAVLSLPGLEIRPERRKIYSNSHEISMTKKSLTSSICWQSIKDGCWLMSRFTKVSETGMQPVARELLLCTTYGIYEKILVISLPFLYSV